MPVWSWLSSQPLKCSSWTVCRGFDFSFQKFLVLVHVQHLWFPVILCIQAYLLLSLSALPSAYSTSQLIFSLLPPTASRQPPAVAPLSWGGIFSSTPSPMSPGDSFLLGAVIAPQRESPEHRQNGNPFPSSDTLWAAVLQSFWLQTPLQMTTSAR